MAKAERVAGKAKKLVIVESPSKAKTINRYLGSEYTVKASMGHVRDLPPNEVGIDFDADFEPVYRILNDKKKIVAALKKVADKAEAVYLATDPDREGEAIAWHLVHALDLDPARVRRVVFNEITESAITAAFAAAHELDMDKVNAQQARRLLDRIVGYQLSPLLCQKITRNLSAGRVQSVAVRIIVEREREIRAFLPVESWRIHGCFAITPSESDRLDPLWSKLCTSGKNGESPTVKVRNAWLSKHGCVHAELVKIAGKEFKSRSADDARRVVEALGFKTDNVEATDWVQYAEAELEIVRLVGSIDRAAAPAFAVKDVQTRRTTSKPGPPFTTAMLQQAASGALGFAPSRTMRVAQQLYEGVDLGDKNGPVGLITYMRTDSVQLSKESVSAARDLIREQFGERYVPDKPNRFSKAKRAQEAHEAIRPSCATRTPDALKASLSAEQWRLYDLIWRRFVACQMTPAQWDNTTLLIAAETSQGEAVFRASGRRLVFDGFQRVMASSGHEDVILPEIESGAPMGAVAIVPSQEYSSPPARYTEASLVKKLEAEGIGRPSTYASIVQTVQDRGYVEQLDRKLHATDKGEIVTDKLVEHFPDIMDVKFTSYMEDELDKIEDAHLDWVHVLREFYGPFKAALDRAQVEMQPARAQPSRFTCEDCGKPMVYRWGRNGRFLSCSAYPECKKAQNVDRHGEPIQVVVSDLPCPKCEASLVVRQSRRGTFLGCSKYPECDHTQPCDERGTPLRKVEAQDIKETCDKCQSPMGVRFMRGKAMLGCSNYPKCKNVTDLPEGIYVEKPPPEDAGARCDKCGRDMVIRKSRRGPFLSCSGFPRCRNAMPLEKLDELKAKAEAGEIPDPPAETAGVAKSGKTRAKKGASVDVAALGPPPAGFAWTRTGKPVVETWPEEAIVCPDCGEEAMARTGRFGVYFSCTAYPKCRFTANTRGAAKKRGEIEFPETAKPKPIPTDIACEECGEPMWIRTGRTGPFLGCSKYPKCKSTKPMPQDASAPGLQEQTLE